MKLKLKMEQKYLKAMPNVTTKLKNKICTRISYRNFKPILRQSEDGSCPGNRREAIISKSQGFKKEGRKSKTPKEK